MRKFLPQEHDKLTRSLSLQGAVQTQNCHLNSKKSTRTLELSWLLEASIYVIIASICTCFLCNFFNSCSSVHFFSYLFAAYLIHTKQFSKGIVFCKTFKIGWIFPLIPCLFQCLTPHLTGEHSWSPRETTTLPWVFLENDVTFLWW